MNIGVGDSFAESAAVVSMSSRRKLSCVTTLCYNKFLSDGETRLDDEKADLANRDPCQSNVGVRRSHPSSTVDSRVGYLEQQLKDL